MPGVTDNHLLVYAGTLSVFLLMAIVITVTGLTVFAIIALLHTIAPGVALEQPGIPARR